MLLVSVRQVLIDKFNHKFNFKRLEMNWTLEDKDGNMLVLSGGFYGLRIRTMYKTYIRLGKRVPKTIYNELGWKRVDFIDENEPCALVLGGNGTASDQAANGYAKHIEALLEEKGVKKEDVAVYSIMYSDDSNEDDYFVPPLLQKRSRELLMEQHGRKKKFPPTPKQKEYASEAKYLYGTDFLRDDNSEISNPKYIESLFVKTLLYRISESGERLSFDEACKRVRKLNVVAHCHGAYVFLKLEEMMQQKMKELGYSKKEAEGIQKQLLCVAYAPYAPLGVSKSTMISFGSAKDEEVWHQNTFHRELRVQNRLNALKLAYFPEKQGNVFIIPSFGQEIKYEHNFPNYIQMKPESSDEVKAFVRFSQNAVANGVKGSLEDVALGDVKTLVCGDDKALNEDFERACQNGKNIYATILRNARIGAFFKERR